MEFTGERFIPNCGLETGIEYEHLQRYLSVKNIVADKRVLDVAAGAGYGSSIMSETANCVFGMDIDHEALLFAQENYHRQNLRYFQGSLADLPFKSGSFDVVVSFETIEHVSEELHGKFIKEILRVLAKDGFLIISTPDKHRYSDLTDYKNEFHLKEYYRQEFYDLLKQSFANVCLLDQLQELTYILTDNTTDFCRILDGNSVQMNGKYIIAVCGQNELPLTKDMVNIIFDREGLHQKKINRVFELQGEIEEKNQNIADNWKMIHERDALIEENWKTIHNRDITIEGLQNDLRMKEESAAALREENILGRSDLKDKNLKIEGLQQQVRAMEKQIADIKNSLDHIKTTKAWRACQFFYQIKSKIWPL